jgi:hypothetical protein
MAGVLACLNACQTAGPTAQQTLDALHRQYDQLLVNWQEAQDRCADDQEAVAATNRAYHELLHANLQSRIDVIAEDWQDARDARRRRWGLDPLPEQPADDEFGLDALERASGAPGIEDGRTGKPGF